MQIHGDHFAMKKRSIDQKSIQAAKRTRKEGAADLQIVVRPSTVPDYLRESEFYQSLNFEDDEEFSVPAKCMKANPNVETLQDVGSLLHTSRFWGMDVEMAGIQRLCLAQPFAEVEC